MKQIITLLLICFFNSLFAQEVLVPYRVNDKWGLSDTKGKIKLDPTYDYIYTNSYFPEGVSDVLFPQGYLGFNREGMRGILHGKKEIICGIYDEFFFEAKSIIGECYRSEESKTLFNLEGEYNNKSRTLLCVGKLGVSTKYEKSPKYILYLGQNIRGRFGVFVYDVDLQGIAGWLLDDYYRINFNKPYDDYPFLSVYKSYNSASEDCRPNLENGKVVLTSKEKKVNINQTEVSNNQYNEDAPAPLDRNVNVQTTIDYSIIDNTIVRKVMGSSTNIEEKVSLPYEVSSLKRIDFNSILKNEKGKVVELKSIVSFKGKNNKQGVLLYDSVIIKPVYDFIEPFYYKLSKDEIINFLVGVKEGENDNLKYGVLDAKGKVLVPVKYDNIDTDLGVIESRSLFDNNSIKLANYKHWKVTISDKQGLLNPDGKFILKPIYDEIKLTSATHRGILRNEFFLLKKDDKYGVFDNRGNKIIADAVFDMEPVFYIENYGKDNFTLIGLIKSRLDKFLFCYARPDGFVYYKE